MNLVSKFLITTCFLTLLTACKDKTEQQGWSDTPQEGTFPLLTIQKEKVQIYSTYPATIKGIRDIEIRPKIEGYIESILVDEGQFVKKGQVLFILYAPQYQDENLVAQARIKDAQAEVTKAQLHIDKTQPLVKEGIISSYELETATLTLKSKESYLAQAKAEWNKSKVNADYTRITAPFDGYIGLLPYKVGTLVSTLSPDPLTTLSDITKVNAYFSMSEQQFLAFSAKTGEQSLLTYLESLSDVELQLANQQTYAEKGHINAISGQIDLHTGSINLRATFPNSQRFLRSGSSGLIRIKEEIEGAIAIPQLATFDIQGKRFVYVVTAAGTLESREIKLLEKEPSSASYVVTHGLRVGDIIVKDEIGGAREGMKVVN